MTKYLLQVNYTVDGTRGLISYCGSKRVSASQGAAESLGDCVESMHFAFPQPRK